MKLRISLFLSLVVLFLASGHRAECQGIITGGITGTVLDQSGAVVPGADILATNVATQQTIHVTTGSGGDFALRDVPIGVYTVTVKATGFAATVLQNVHVAAGNAVPLPNLVVKPSGASETVEVEGNTAVLLQTTSSQGEEVIDSEQLQALPVNGAFDDSALVVPGVVATHANGFSNTNGVNFSVNGQRGRANNFELDGQTNNDNSVTGPQIFFSNQDAVAELEVITNNFSAQYGRNMGSVVNYLTRSGTDTFHGSAFEFYTGNWASSLFRGQKAEVFGFCAPGVSSSTGCTTPVVPRFVQNDFGGTLGGPILRNKLFFFGSGYFGHTYQGATRSTTGGDVFPDKNGLSTLQSTYPNNPGVAELVNDGPYAFPIGNPSPIGTPSLMQVTDGTTTSSIEVAPYSRDLSTYSLDQEDLGRIDYQLDPNDRFYARFLYQDNPTAPFAGTFVTGGYSNVTDDSYSIGSDWTHTFGPHWVNQLRYAFQQATLAFDGGGVPKCTITALLACPSTVNFGGTIEGLGYPNNLPQGRVVKVTQIQDNATATVGQHSLYFGGEFDYQNSPNVFLPVSSGEFTFTPGISAFSLRGTASGSPSYNGLSGLLQGVSFTSLTTGSVTDHFTEPDVFLYLQDDWRIRPSLTLNLGLRWEFFDQSVNLLHNLTVAQQTGSHPFWNTSLPLSATTFPEVSQFYKNIEPRLGFAWNPEFDRSLVVHGGFAINVDPAFDNIFIDIASLAPVANAGSFSCDGVTVSCLPGSGLTFGSVNALDDQFVPTGSDPRAQLEETVPTNFRQPLTESYTLGLQHQITSNAVAEVRYVGNHTMHQFQSLDSNPEIATVAAYFPTGGYGGSYCTNTNAPGFGRLNCNYSTPINLGNTAFSIYNSLQTSLTLRKFHGWTGTVAYTWSRAIDNASEIFSTFSGGNTITFPQNPLDTNVGERAVSGDSFPNVVGMQLVYAEPFFSDEHGIVGRLLGGWQMNTFYTYNSGQPFTPYQSLSSFSPYATSAQSATSFCDFGFNANFIGADACRPILSNPKAPLNSVGLNTGSGYVDYALGTPVSPSQVHWLYNNQYEALARNNPFPGVGRNTLRGDTWNDVDASMYKNVRLTERFTTQLQLSAFNVLNRAYYGTPDPFLDDVLQELNGPGPGFLSNLYNGGSQATVAAGGAQPQSPGNRSIQLGVEVRF